MSRALAAAVLALSTAASAQSYLDEVGQGSLLVRPKNPSTTEPPRPFPLKHTDVNVEISGFVSRVHVTQKFQNPYKEVIEAVYVFPLPDNAAVDTMTMKVGGRTVRGVIQRKEEARATYEQAKSRGQAAALLDEERPNIFTQSVANIRPGDEVEIEIRFAATLKYDNGGYEFHFPMVVGPRFIPGRPLAGDSQGTGWAPDTEKVPDASRITPQVLPKGMRSAHDIAVRVVLDAGVPIQSLRSPSHKIDVVQSDEDLAEVNLTGGDYVPNKDFVLRYDVAGENPAMGLLATRTSRGGYFSLMIQPKAKIRDEEIAPRELVFVFDTSGSQMGAPLVKQKEVVRQALAGMRPGDTFRILDFNERLTAFSREALPWNGSNAERAMKYIEGLQAGGGTFMLEAIQEVLRTPAEPGRMRMIAFLTDGYIGNDDEVLAAVEQDLGDARLFSFGVGSSVNRYLIERMAVMGRGVAQVVRPDEDTKVAVNRFHERIARPLLTDIRIDWGDLAVRDVYPAKIPDLFSAQPVILNARFDRPGKGRVVLRGRLSGRPFEQVMEVNLPERETRHESLGSVWARARVEDREQQMYRGEKPELVREITELALEHELVTKWTSFVAVEDRVVNEGGVQKTVAVPVEMPEFVEHEGVFEDASKNAMYPSGLGISGLGSGAGSMGSLGVMGSGRGGGGSASYSGSVSLGAAPKARMARPQAAPEASYAPAAPPPPPAAPAADAPAATLDSSESGGFLGRLFSRDEKRRAAAEAKKENEEQREAAEGDALVKAPPALRITLGEVKSSGAPAPSDVKVQLERYLEAQRPWLLGARGTITLRVVVGADGKVSRVEIVGSTLGESHEKRLVEAARKWTFARGAIALTVPITIGE